MSEFTTRGTHSNHYTAQHHEIWGLFTVLAIIPFSYWTTSYMIFSDTASKRGPNVTQPGSGNNIHIIRTLQCPPHLETYTLLVHYRRPYLPRAPIFKVCTAASHANGVPAKAHHHQSHRGHRFNLTHEPFVLLLISIDYLIEL